MGRKRSGGVKGKVIEKRDVSWYAIRWEKKKSDQEMINVFLMHDSAAIFNHPWQSR